jgi:hypothetical protein
MRTVVACLSTAKLLGALLHVVAQFHRTLAATATPFVPGRAHLDAAEHMGAINAGGSLWSAVTVVTWSQQAETGDAPT